MPVAPYSQDVLTRIVNVNWGFPAQQGLLAEYSRSGSGIDPVPTAHALDSGDIFSGVNMGASGLGYTVLTTGLVCFGKPRDGPSCFLACTEYNLATDVRAGTIKRGTLNDDGDLVWESTAEGGEGLVALTFAGDAFHAVYCVDDGTFVATSFDGLIWSRVLAFPSQDQAVRGGTVAFNGDKKDSVGNVTEAGSYAAAGFVDIDTSGQDPAYFFGFIRSLSWSAAAAPPPPPASGNSSLSWNFGAVSGIDEDPGFEATHQQLPLPCTAAGGKGMFVAPAYSKVKTVVQLDEDLSLVAINTTAVIAVSSDGNSWSTVPLPGVTQGSYEQSGNSHGLAVVFIRTSKDEGYFLGSSFNFPGSESFTMLHRSDDGSSWSEIRQSSGAFYFTLSAIAKDLDSTTIVTI